MTDPAQRRRTALLTTAVLACTPLVAVAAPRHDSTPARITTAAAAGVVYGGVTDDGFGLMVEANKSRRQIVRMATGLTLQCASGDTFSTSDGWARLSVKKGKFSGTFGPSTQRNDDGTTVDIEGVVSGKFNRAKTSISGTWSLKGIEHDATGAVTDTCGSGTIHWTAKQ